MKSFKIVIFFISKCSHAYTLKPVFQINVKSLNGKCKAKGILYVTLHFDKLQCTNKSCCNEKYSIPIIY